MQHKFGNIGLKMINAIIDRIDFELEMGETTEDMIEDIYNEGNLDEYGISMKKFKEMIKFVREQRKR